MPWGTANAASNVASEVITMKTAGYSNTFVTSHANTTANGVFRVTPAAASGKGHLSAGWAHQKIGSGYVASVTVGAGGTGYVQGAAVTFSAPQLAGGVTATGTLNVSGGAITSVTITNPGSGYIAVPTVTAPTGTGATLTAVAGGRVGRKEVEVLVVLNS